MTLYNIKAFTGDIHTRDLTGERGESGASRETWLKVGESVRDNIIVLKDGEEIERKCGIVERLSYMRKVDQGRWRVGYRREMKEGKGGVRST